MSETSPTEAITSLKESKPVVDILGDIYQFHWTSIHKLSEIISKGIYSPAYAKKIGAVYYRDRLTNSQEPHVYITPYVTDVWANLSEAVGLVLDVPEKKILFRKPEPRSQRVKYRISPRYFRGLVICDRLPTEKYANDPLAPVLIDPGKATVFTNEMIERIQSTGNVLPIYGLEGDLLWPQQIPHSQIVEASKGKKE